MSGSSGVGSMMLRLIMMSEGAAAPRELTIDGEPLVIGRSRERSDVVLPVQRLSQRHVLFQPREDRLYEVVDLHSRNGTLLDGSRMEAGRPYPLVGGEQLLLPGGVSVTIEFDDAYRDESFTMETSSQMTRSLARDFLSSTGEAVDAYFEIVDGADAGQRVILPDEIQRAFIGAEEGAWYRLRGANAPARAITIERTPDGFCVTPAQGVRASLDGEELGAGATVLVNAQVLSVAGRSFAFFDPCEIQLALLDGIELASSVTRSHEEQPPAPVEEVEAIAPRGDVEARGDAIVHDERGGDGRGVGVYVGVGVLALLITLMCLGLFFLLGA